MDYEKKYNDALERARNLAHDNVWVTTIFPELKESEDERIRKILIESFENANCSKVDEFVNCKLNKGEILAYLERQKEQKPAEKISVSEELYEHIRNACACIEDAMSSDTMCDMTDYLTMADSSAQKAFDMVERLVIQKPAEWSEEDNQIIKIIISYLDSVRNTKDTYGESEIDYSIFWLKDLPNRFAIRPKQEWSEEDEQYLLVCKNALNKYQQSDHWDASIISNWLENRLKSLSLQPKQEWSEEDETAFGDLMWCIEQARKSAKNENDMGDIWYAEHWLNNRLKSLRPQPHWKPSEEQMRALMWQIKNTSEGSWQRMASESLYNDLQKLL